VDPSLQLLQAHELPAAPELGIFPYTAFEWHRNLMEVVSRYEIVRGGGRGHIDSVQGCAWNLHFTG
jgi:hypothetical protein